MNRTLLAIAAFVAGSTAPLAADLIHLRDGRTLDGTIVSAADAPTVDVRITSASYQAIVHLDPADIAAIDPGPSAYQRELDAILAGERGLGDDGSAGDWLALARRADALHEIGLARRLAQQALSRDRSDADAHRLLGQVEQNGVWMTPADAARARGEVWFRGNWTPEAQARATEERERQAAADEQQRRDAERQRAAAAQAYSSAEPAYGDTTVFSDGYSSSGYGYGYGYGYPSYSPYGFSPYVRFHHHQPQPVVPPPAGYPARQKWPQ